MTTFAFPYVSYLLYAYIICNFLKSLPGLLNILLKIFQDTKTSISETLTAKLRLETSPSSSKLLLEPTALASKLRPTPTSLASKLQHEPASPASKLRLEPISTAKLLFEPAAAAVSSHTPTSPRSLPRPPGAAGHFDFRRGGTHIQT